VHPGDLWLLIQRFELLHARARWHEALAAMDRALHTPEFATGLLPPGGPYLQEAVPANPGAPFGQPERAN